MAPRVIVVGGGIAGLVIARDLVLRGREVTLVEASGRLGGTVAAHTVGGIELDAGAESFATRGGVVAELATGLGLEVVAPNPASAWLHTTQGTTVPLPATSLLGIPSSPLAEDVAAVVGRKATFRALADSLYPATVGAKVRTLGELVRRRMGDAILEQLVAPVTLGVHSKHPDDLELDRVAPGLRNALLRRGSLAAAVLELRSNAPAGSAVAGIRGGVHRLVSALAAELDRFGAEVLLASRATEVEATGVTVKGRRLDGQVVVAAPHILGESFAADARVTLATLVVEAPALDAAPRGTGVLVTKGAPGVRAKALTHSTAKWPWLREAAAGHHVLRLSYDEEPAALAETARADAEALLGVALPPSAVVEVARVEWSRPAPATLPPGSPVAVGESIAGTGLANTIRHAREQARELAGDA